MAASALFGVVVTVIMGKDPGNVLGAFVVVGTLLACLAVRARSVRLLIPAPTMSYVPAAMIAGAIHDRATDTSHYMDLLNAGSWIANGFLMMALATVAAIVFTALRLYLAWHYRPRPRRYPRPGPVPGGGDWDAARRLRPDPAAPAQTAPVGQAGWDQTRPIGSDTGTAPYRPQDNGTGPYRPQDNGTGPYRPQDNGTGPYRPRGSGSYQAQDTGSSRPRPGRPEDSSPYRTDRAPDSSAYPAPSSARRRAIGPAKDPESRPYPAQSSGPYQAGSGPYPEPTDLAVRSRSSPGVWGRSPGIAAVLPRCRKVRPGTCAAIRLRSPVLARIS